MAPSDAADPRSELPFRLQQSFKNTPVLVLFFKLLQSQFVQCSLKRRLNLFITVWGVWKQVGSWGENQLLHRYLKYFHATDWHKKTGFIGKWNACMTIFMLYICSLTCSGVILQSANFFFFTAGSTGLICVINVADTSNNLRCTDTWSEGREKLSDVAIDGAMHPVGTLPPFSVCRKQPR